ncbi:MAG: tetratricopeptide repeat protein, partial [Bacteroidetes bacterium]|nr:tetratricopeptide repeat protein [Bacteroidota bacterium]
TQGINTDSLIQITQQAPDRQKQQALQVLVQFYKNNDPQTALQYIMKLVELNERLNDDIALAKAYQNAGILNFRLGNFARAKEFYLLALDKFVQQKNTDAQNEINGYLAAVYYATGNLPLAADTYLKVLRYYEEKNDKAALLNILTSLGSIYSRLNNFSKALEYNLRALRIYEESSDKFRTLVGYDNIGNIYLRQGNLQKAGEFFNKSLLVYRELNNKAGEASTLFQLGNIADKQNDVEEAIVYYQKAIDVAKAIKSQPMQTTAELALAVFVGARLDVKGMVGLIDFVDVVLGLTSDVGKEVRVLVVVFVEVLDAVVV